MDVIRGNRNLLQAPIFGPRRRRRAAFRRFAHARLTPGVVTAECFLDVFFSELEILGMMGSYQVVTHKFKVGL
jgi:hypothetical protein